MNKVASLTSKVARQSILILFLTCFSISLIIFFPTSYILKKANKHSLQNEAQLISENIENNLLSISHNITLLSKTPPIQGLIRSVNNSGFDTKGSSTTKSWSSRLSSLFTSVLENNPEYTQIRFIGLADNGKEIVRVDQTNHGIFTSHASSLQSKGGRKYFKESIKLSRGGVYFSDINYNIEKGKLQYPLISTLRVATPIYTDKNKVFGILIININAELFFKSILSHLNLNDNIILYDNYGNFFFYDKKIKTMNFIMHGQEIKSKLLDLNTLKNTKNLMQHLHKKSNIDSISYPIHLHKTTQKKVFTLIIISPKTTLISQAPLITLTSLLATLFFFILASTIIYFTSKSKLQPFTELARNILISRPHESNNLNTLSHQHTEYDTLKNEFERTTHQLEQLCMHNSLTGLANRASFIKHLESHLASAIKNNTILTVIYIDINNFNNVNELYGFELGDKLLIKFSQALKSISQPTDFCAHLHTDIFAIISEQQVYNKTSLKTLLSIYQDGLNNTYSASGTTLNIVISGGASTFPNDATNQRELLIHANQAMLLSKKNGSGEILFYDTDSKQD